MKNTYTVKLEKEWVDALDKAFSKKQKTVSVPGFRKGKVTKDIYIKHFGIESLYMDATDLVLQTGYEKVIKENDLKPAASPKVDIKNINDKAIEIEYTIVTSPEVKLGKYKDLGIKKDKVEVSKEEIEHELDNLKAKYVELKDKEKGNVEKGNIAVIDFEGFLRGKPFDGGKGENYSLEIGSNTFIPGFEDQLIGMKKGEEKEIKVTFPKEYPAPDLKGKEVTFKVKVNSIQEKIMPEIGKEFFEDLAMEGVNDLESLKKEIEENIKVNKERDAENKYIDDVLKEVTKNAKFTLPEEMIEDEIDRMIKEFSNQLQMQGFNLETYLEMIRSDEATLRNQMKEEATNRVSYRVVLEQVVKDEKIDIKDEEVEKEAEELAKKYGMEKEEFVNAFGGKEFIKYDMEVRKALEIIQG